jgi:xanthine dehydrogenase/oxidase
MEEVIWGDSKEKETWIKKGHLRTKGPGTYKIPSIGDIPLDFRIHLLDNCANEYAVYRSKAIGEPPLFMGASVFFAIKDAISSARKDSGVTGFLKLNSPATSEKIRMSCEDKIAKLFK